MTGDSILNTILHGMVLLSDLNVDLDLGLVTDQIPREYRYRA